MYSEWLSKHQSTSVQMHMLKNGAAHLVIRGPLSRRGLEWLKAEVSNSQGGKAATGFLADCRGVTVAFTGEDLDAATAGTGPHDPASLPVAMLVRSDQRETFRLHCIRMALRGMSRRVFTEQAEATAWLESLQASQTSQAVASA